MLRHKILIKLFLYLYGFLFVFNPGNFFNFNLLYVLGGFSVLHFIFSKGLFYSYISNKRIITLFFMSFLAIFYLVILYLSGAEDAITRAYSFSLVIISLLCALTLYSLFKSVYSLNLLEVLRYIVGLGVIQLLFVLLAVILPEFREWTLLTARQALIHTISNDAGSGLRSFGLATGYTSTFPMLMGLCGLFSIYIASKNDLISNKIYYSILVVAFIFSVILNARIGLVPIVLWLFFAPLFFLFRKNIKVLLLSIPLIGLISLIPNLSLFHSSYFDRFLQGVNELRELGEGNSTGTFETLSQMWFFPNDFLDFFFGMGVNIIGNYPVGSDIGIVQDIYMYGVLGTVFILISLIYSGIPMLSSFNRNFGSIFVFCFFVSLALYYMKGMNFYVNEVSNMILFLMVFCCLSKDRAYSSIRKPIK